MRQVIYPPVDTEAFAFADRREDFYLTASRLVPYKRVDLLIEAFAPYARRAARRDRRRPRAAPAAHRWLDRTSRCWAIKMHDTLCDYMQRAKAFLFAAREDFGIVLVEAQAAGTPVIALGQGGGAGDGSSFGPAAADGCFVRRTDERGGDCRHPNVPARTGPHQAGQLPGKRPAVRHRAISTGIVRTRDRPMGPLPQSVVSPPDGVRPHASTFVPGAPRGASLCSAFESCLMPQIAARLKKTRGAFMPRASA